MITAFFILFQTVCPWRRAWWWWVWTVSFVFNLYDFLSTRCFLSSEYFNLYLITVLVTRWFVVHVKFSEGNYFSTSACIGCLAYFKRLELADYFVNFFVLFFGFLVEGKKFWSSWWQWIESNVMAFITEMMVEMWGREDEDMKRVR